MKKVAIIGAGISGLSVANLLKRKGYEVIVFEKELTPGGLIRCKRINGSLYHLCGGHVFNSKRKDVLDWFWSVFNRDTEFSKADRNAIIFTKEKKYIPYPIEDHIYLFDENTQKSCIQDLCKIVNNINLEPQNFEEFLRYKFGKTLFELYFKPYNEKIWRRDLQKVPLTWLEGKLPMPTVEQIIFNNINHIEERQFVHSSFWYEKENGSQYIADKLAQEINVIYNNPIESIVLKNNRWSINQQEFDSVVFCGNIKDLPDMIKGISLGDDLIDNIINLEYHGTTSVFCEIDKNPYSWIYLSDPEYKCHRIICTGNFAISNNAVNKMTATVEFTDYISKEEILKNLSRIPLNPKYLSHYYSQYTYPIQDRNTRMVIKRLKDLLAQTNFYFTGRFANWEYYNMDVAIGSAMDLCNQNF